MTTTTTIRTTTTGPTTTTSPEVHGDPAQHPVAPRSTEEWTPVCRLSAILPDTGVAALVSGRQIAIFRLRDDRLFAIDNHDPCSGANVLARGILGDVDGEPFVASPVHKQRFELTTGRCLDEAVRVGRHPVRVRAGRVEVGA
jgi:nitrite reductase (NADH) small subunit